MAMLDALELSECLTGKEFKDLRTAIAFYENKMRQRASEAARMTLEQTSILHSPQAIPHLLEMFKVAERNKIRTKSLPIRESDNY